MSHPGRSTRVAVVGGGVLGVSTAAQLAKRGAEVTLVTEGSLASGASGRSLSWLNYCPGLGVPPPPPAGSRPLPHPLVADRRIRLAEVRRRPHLAGRGRASRSTATPSTHAAGRLRRRVAAAATRSPRGRRASTSPPSPTKGPIFYPGEGWVELPPLVDHLAQVVVAHGGEIRTDAGRWRSSSRTAASPESARPTVGPPRRRRRCWPPAPPFPARSPSSASRSRTRRRSRCWSGRRRSPHRCARSSTPREWPSAPPRPARWSSTPAGRRRRS